MAWPCEKEKNGVCRRCSRCDDWNLSGSCAVIVQPELDALEMCIRDSATGLKSHEHGMNDTLRVACLDHGFSRLLDLFREFCVGIPLQGPFVL